MQTFTLYLYRVTTWVMRIAYVNILWIGFILTGLVIFGAIPSTVAMFGVIRKWISGDEELPVFKTFWNLWKKEFLRSNILGYILAFVGMIFYVDFRFVNELEGNLSFFLLWAMLPFLFFYLVILLYIFPVFVHYKMKIKDYIKFSFILGVKNPLLSLSMLVLISMVSYVTLFEILPAFVFFGGSVSGYILMWGAKQAIEKNEVHIKTDN